MSYTGAGKYSHHTGKEYQVLAQGINKETEEPCIIYTRETESGLLWFTRSLASFNAQTFRRVGANDADGECLEKFKKTKGELRMEDLRK